MIPHIAEIRSGILRSYSEDELQVFCSDYFPKVLDEFSKNAAPIVKVDSLIQYCYRNNLLDQLLKHLERERPHIFFGQLMTWHSSSLVISQLRPIPAAFCGRAKEVEFLTTQMRLAKPYAIPVWGIEGMAGVGKTELANAVAHNLSPDFPDAQLFVPLGTHSNSPLTTSQALAYCIRSLYPDVKLTDDMHELVRQYQLMLDGKRVLIVFDDARDDSQITSLLPPIGNGVIVTSRRRFDTVQQITLNTLSHKFSTLLLKQLCPRLLDEEADELASLCGELPIALSVVGGLFNSKRVLRVSDYLRDINKNGLGAIRSSSRQLDINSFFESSYLQLDPTLQKAFCSLCVMPSEFDWDAAQAMLSPFEAEYGVPELVATNMILWNETTELFRLHDLIRIFVASKLTDVELQRAKSLHAHHFVALAKKISIFFMKDIDSRRQALKLLDANLTHLDAAFFNLIASHEYDLLAKLCEALNTSSVYFGYPILFLRLHPHERAQWAEAHIRSATIIGDWQSQFNALNSLVFINNEMGIFSKSFEYAERQRLIAIDHSDSVRECMAYRQIGETYRQSGNIRGALGAFERQLKLASTIEHEALEAIACGHIGMTHRTLTRNYSLAIDFLTLQLVWAEQNSDFDCERFTLDNLGVAYRHLNNLAAAISAHRRDRKSVV